MFSKKLEELLIHKRRIILRGTMTGLRDNGKMTARFRFAQAGMADLILPGVS